MGNAQQAKAKQKHINQQLLQEHKEEQKKANVLLFGVGGSGKKTALNQLKLTLTNAGICEQQKQQILREIIHRLFSVLPILFEEAKAKGEITNPNLEAYCEKVKGWNSACADAANNTRAGCGFTYLADEQIEVIQSLWKETSIQQALSRIQPEEGYDRKLNYIDYFLHNAHQFKEGYQLTNQDILRAGSVDNGTRGVTEELMQFEQIQINFIDLSHQLTERRKWIHMFSDVTAILFMIPLDRYGPNSMEMDPLQESIRLLAEVLNKLKDVSVIVCFSKIDKFTQLAIHKDLSCSFADYKGGLDAAQALNFVRLKVTGLNSNPKRKILTMDHCLIDDGENLARFIRDSIRSIILSDMMGNSPN